MWPRSETRADPEPWKSSNAGACLATWAPPAKIAHPATLVLKTACTYAFVNLAIAEATAKTAILNRENAGIAPTTIIATMTADACNAPAFTEGVVCCPAITKSNAIASQDGKATFAMYQHGAGWSVRFCRGPQAAVPLRIQCVDPGSRSDPRSVHAAFLRSGSGPFYDFTSATVLDRGRSRARNRDRSPFDGSAVRPARRTGTDRRQSASLRQRFNSVVLADADDYVCTAENSAGRTTATFRLEVHQRPRIRTEPKGTVRKSEGE
ncbi:unnamed protein product, partial [Nesidiocoris tenuis]